jgi:hypothetical protein
MSERNKKLLQLEKKIEDYRKETDFLIAAIKLKDRLLLEFAVCLTAHKITIPMHILKIMNTLYPDHMQGIAKIEQEIDANVEAIKQAESKKESGEEDNSGSQTNTDSRVEN